MKVIVSLPDGATRDAVGKAGGSVMELIRGAGLPIRAECGGAMACATCHAHIDEAWIARVGPAQSEESDLLDNSDYRTDRSRLCCQIKATDALDGLRLALQLDAFEG